MRIPRIYTDQPLAANTSVELDAALAHYVVNVLRMKEGRPITLFNGMGGEYSGLLSAVSKKSAVVSLESFQDVSFESSIEITLGVCLIKNDRMDWLLQKAAELGVNCINPLLSEYIDVKLPANRIEKKVQHWQQVLINACQQSGRTHVPLIGDPQPLNTWVDSVEADYKLVLHPYNAKRLDQSASPAHIALLVGPEGGLTDDEVASAAQKGFIPFGLGPRILRAETAPLAALSILQYQFGDI